MTIKISNILTYTGLAGLTASLLTASTPLGFFLAKAFFQSQIATCTDVTARAAVGGVSVLALFMVTSAITTVSLGLISSGLTLKRLGVDSKEEPLSVKDAGIAAATGFAASMLLKPLSMALGAFAVANCVVRNAK